MTTTKISKEATDRYADVKGIKIHYNEAGQGPTLMCFHGGGPGANAWDNTKHNVDALSRHFHVMLVDLPGYGYSDKEAKLGSDPLDVFWARLVRDLMDLKGIERTHLGFKRWGVYSHHVVEKLHPLVATINTRFDVPHSRYNEIFREDMEKVGLKVLVESGEAGVHLAVSPDLMRVVFFQGHPEYDTISLLKEYKREAMHNYRGERDDYPPFPEHYFNQELCDLLNEYGQHLRSARRDGQSAPEFPENMVLKHLDNTWRDTAKAVFNNWLGLIYQVTDQDRQKPFMDHVDPDNPLGLNL
jgi:homoserine trans-succinylase